MGKRSLYLPDELEARVQARAESDGRSFSNFIQWALGQALGSAQQRSEGTAGIEQAGPSPVPSSRSERASGQAASTRASAPLFNRATRLGPSAPVPKRGE